jgi:glutathione-independent formaldehyde dehydrogenase
LISAGKAKPFLIISHELALDEAPDAYKHFDAPDKGWTKVILKPEKSSKKMGAKK